MDKRLAGAGDPKRTGDKKRSTSAAAYATRAEARSATGGGRRAASAGSAGASVGRGASRGSSASPARQPTRSAGGPRVATIGGGSERPVKEAPRRKALPTANAPVRKPRTSATSPKPGSAPAAGELERLQKVLATAGIGSRRVAEDMISAGRVRVDGQIATLGDKVDAVNAEIYVDGERVITDAKRVYLAINKPAGVVSTMSDEKGREALGDYLGNVRQRVYHVGRLDADSEGLLIMTNDGALAHRLTHPSYGVPKTYLAEVPGPIKGNLRQRLMDGVELDDGPARADGFRVVDSLGKRILVEITLHEGRKHIVRRMLAEVGHPVSRLVRTSIGPIKLGDLKVGRTRRLTRPEIAALFRAVEDEETVEYEDVIVDVSADEDYYDDDDLESGGDN